MDLRDLVRAIFDGDLLRARQYVADFHRRKVRWEQMEQPLDLNACEMSLAAGLVELLAARSGGVAPAWTKTVGPAAEILVLDPGLEKMPRSFAHAKAAGPESLRKRNLIALPDFLDVA
jgi:hypothetical protein